MTADELFDPQEFEPKLFECAAVRNRCGTCVHLWSKTGHFAGSFLKCDQTVIRNDVQSTGPDMRAWWPACTRYEQPSESTETRES